MKIYVDKLLGKKRIFLNTNIDFYLTILMRTNKVTTKLLSCILEIILWGVLLLPGTQILL